MIRVEIGGLQQASQRLSRVERAVLRGVYNAINRSGTAGRKEAVARISTATGISKKTVRASFFRPKRAGFKRSTYFSGASSAGIPINEYRYTMERVGYGRNKTRARIRVGWVTGGEKIAAGFINPFGRRRLGLRTRGKDGKRLLTPDTPAEALGPSIAAAFKAMPARPVEDAIVNAFGRFAPASVNTQLARI